MYTNIDDLVEVDFEQIREENYKLFYSQQLSNLIQQEPPCGSCVTPVLEEFKTEIRTEGSPLNNTLQGLLAWPFGYYCLIVQDCSITYRGDTFLSFCQLFQGLGDLELGTRENKLPFIIRSWSTNQRGEKVIRDFQAFHPELPLPKGPCSLGAPQAKKARAS
jgi:hypothetical protein